MCENTVETQQEFYERFLKCRNSFYPPDFGVNLSLSDFVDKMVSAFTAVYREAWTVDELLLHPREAAKFCDDVRRRYGYYDLPDDIILRTLIL